MSDSETPGDIEERLLSELIEELDLGADLLAGGQTSPKPELRRQYVELLGLLPAGLEPMAVSAGVRSNLLRRAGGSAGERSESIEPRVSDFPNPSRQPSRAAGFGRGGRWLLPVAAALGFLLLGLSGWQFSVLREQKRTIGEMASRIRSLESATQAEAASESAERMPSPLSFVTSPGVEICPLRPMGDDPVFASVRGVLYVAADHQRWYLNVEGLEPCPEGSAYKVWFHAEQGPVEAGVLEVVEGSRVELVSNRAIPLDMQGVSITMEPMDGSSQPAGQQILWGDEMVRVL